MHMSRSARLPLLLALLLPALRYLPCCAAGRAAAASACRAAAAMALLAVLLPGLLLPALRLVQGMAAPRTAPQKDAMCRGIALCTAVLCLCGAVSWRVFRHGVVLFDVFPIYLPKGKPRRTATDQRLQCGC